MKTFCFFQFANHRDTSKSKQNSAFSVQLLAFAHRVSVNTICIMLKHFVWYSQSFLVTEVPRNSLKRKSSNKKRRCEMTVAVVWDAKILSPDCSLKWASSEVEKSWQAHLLGDSTDWNQEKLPWKLLRTPPATHYTNPKVPYTTANIPY